MNTKKRTPVQQIIELCNQLFKEQDDSLSAIMHEVLIDYCLEQEEIERKLLIQAFCDGQNIATNNMKLTATKYLKQIFTDKTEDENTNAKFDMLHGSDTGRNKRSRKKKAA
jgi:hypothetical protein